MQRGTILLLAFALLTPPRAALAQLGGLGHGLAPGGAGQLGSDLSSLVTRTGRVLDSTDLLDLRTTQIDALMRAHPQALDRDDHGAPVVRGEVLVVAPTARSLDIAAGAGFRLLKPADAEMGEAGVVVLATPPGLSARAAVKRLRGLDPAGTFDFNHIYLPAGPAAVFRPATLEAAPTARTAPAAARIGLIDTGVAVGAPVFAGAPVEQRSFAAGPAKAAAHGTEVASLLVGRGASFHGAAPGAALLVADVYGADPAGGSAEALAKALFWLAGRQVRIVNISLVGPANAALGAAVKALVARGMIVVAAVGNDGPAAPPAYPASYPGVVAVTGVDARGRVLFEAGRAAHLDFAAPGADMAAATLGGGYVAVRGTSFAAPLVAGELAMLAGQSELAASAAVDSLSARARPGPAYGRGLVAMDLRTPPAVVHAAGK